MPYFKKLLDLLKIEREKDRSNYLKLTETTSIADRRASGLTWYPIAIRGTGPSRGDYFTVEVERPSHQDIAHQFRFGVPAVLFSNHDPKKNRVEGTITHQNNNRLKITLFTDELPDWSRDGTLGDELLNHNNSYDEMQNALKQASAIREKPEGRLTRILTGEASPQFNQQKENPALPGLNSSQQA